MFDQNSSKEEQQQYKKKKEWNAIKNCIPLINKCLQLNIDAETYDDKYFRESRILFFSITINLLEWRSLNVILL